MFRRVSKGHNNVVHYFSAGECINCKKTIQELFDELLDSDNKDALAYCFKYTTGQCSYELSTCASIIKANHPFCLTNEEMMIKDIIE